MPVAGSAPTARCRWRRQRAPVRNAVARCPTPAIFDSQACTTRPLHGCLGRVDRDSLIDVVAEKTGYPAEVLDLDMQLDADLGIDSIKRVEILSALQERFPDLPAPPSRWLLGTLREIVGVHRPDSWARTPAARSAALAALPAAVRICAGSCWRRWPRRPAIPPRCSSSTCGSTPTWASTRSSGSRSSRPSRTGSRTSRRRPRTDRDPRHPARIVALLGRTVPRCDRGRRLTGGRWDRLASETVVA